jgi:hypothetical protein
LSCANEEQQKARSQNSGVHAPLFFFAALSHLLLLLDRDGRFAENARATRITNPDQIINLLEP